MNSFRNVRGDCFGLGRMNPRRAVGLPPKAARSRGRVEHLLCAVRSRTLGDMGTLESRREGGDGDDPDKEI